MKLRLFSALAVAGLLATVPPASAAEPVRAVADLDFSRYAGTWHEIAHLPVSFQKKCLGDITATYALRDEGKVSVVNRCRTADGTIEAEGVARPVAGAPGKLEVRFAPAWLSWLPMVWADYWVIALDPEYQWAVVGEPDRRYLWILSRAPTMSASQLETLKGRAEAMGYELSALQVMAPVN